MQKQHVCIPSCGKTVFFAMSDAQLCRIAEKKQKVLATDGDL